MLNLDEEKTNVLVDVMVTALMNKDQCIEYMEGQIEDLGAVIADFKREREDLKYQIDTLKREVNHRSGMTFLDLICLLDDAHLRNNKIWFIKQIRSITGCGLREAKNFADEYIKGLNETNEEINEESNNQEKTNELG